MPNESTTILIDDAIGFNTDMLFTSPDNCFLVALNYQQIQLLLSLTRYAQAGHLWRASDTYTAADVSRFVENVRGCLLMGCDVSQLIAAVNRVAEAIEGGAGSPNNTALDAIASEAGVSAKWTVLKAALIAAFPEGAIPIGVGVEAIRALVDDNSNVEGELVGVVAALGGSTAGLPD